MSKYKKGEYLYMQWDDKPEYELVYGHVTKEEAVLTIYEERDVNMEACDMDHKYMRVVKASLIDEPYEGAMQSILYDKGGKGAMPVTVMYY